MLKESDVSSLRTFIAIPVSDGVRAAVSALADSLKKGMAGDAKWVAPENYHLTMVFTGSVHPDIISVIENVISSIKTRRFQIVFDRLGVFPSSAKAKVLWTGMQAGVESCSGIASELVSGLRKKGLELEGKPFSGHLTICRFRQPVKIDGKALELKVRIPTMCAEKIVLYKSVLKPAGPVYSEIYSFMLEDL